MTSISSALGRCFIAACVLLLFSAAPASATWSIVGTDEESGDVGVAIASCVPSFAIGDTTELMALVPGVGAGVSQANLNRAVPGQMQGLLADGVTAAEIVRAVSDPAFDGEFNERQHGVVLVDGSAAAFTGANALDVALDQQAIGVSAQGNILVSEAVVADSVAAFQATSGELADRLVAALLAGSLAGGDSRCPEQTALFATVAVVGVDDDPAAPSFLLHYAVETDASENPVQLLADAHAAGLRQANETPSITAELGGTLLILGLGTIGIIGFFSLVWLRRKAN